MLFCLTHTSARAQIAAIQSCRAVKQSPLEIREGSGSGFLYVDQEAVGYGAGQLLVIGQTLVHRASGLSPADVGSKAAAGAIIGLDGRATPIAPPADAGEMFAPRVDRAGDRWQVAWVDVISRDSAARTLRGALAYATFDGTRWSSVSRGHEVYVLRDNPRLISKPWTTNNGFVMALPVRLPSGDAVVVSEKRGSLWDIDTLLISNGLTYAATARMGQRFIVAYSGRDDRGEPALLAMHSDDGGLRWQSPTMIAQGAAAEPILFSSEGQLGITWVGLAGSGGPRGIWIAWSESGRWTRPTLLTGGEHAQSVAVIPRRREPAVLISASSPPTSRVAFTLSAAGRSVVVHTEGSATPPFAIDGVELESPEILMVSSRNELSAERSVPRMSLQRFHIRCRSSEK